MPGGSLFYCYEILLDKGHALIGVFKANIYYTYEHHIIQLIYSQTI